MSHYELHDLSEEHAASIFGVVVNGVGKCSGDVVSQSFKLKKGRRHSRASRNSEQAVSTMQCVFGSDNMKQFFWCWSLISFASLDFGMPWNAEEFFYMQCCVFT